MKIRRLSEIDLARFAALPAGPMLEQALRQYNASGGIWSYDPVRLSTADIVGAKTPLIGYVPSVSWPDVAGQITKACHRGSIQVAANLEVGKVLFDATRRLRWSAAKVVMGALPIGIGESVRYWSDVVIEDSNGQFVAFFDHRRERGIANSRARQIVFSMQHLWVRERNPDLMDARLAVVRFPSANDGRGIGIDFHDDVELLSYDELSGRVRTVYETWARVSDDRMRKGGATGTGGGNPFGF